MRDVGIVRYGASSSTDPPPSPSYATPQRAGRRQPTSPPGAPLRSTFAEMKQYNEPDKEAFQYATRRLGSMYSAAFDAVGNVYDEVFYMEVGDKDAFFEAYRMFASEPRKVPWLYEQLARFLRDLASANDPRITAHDVQRHITLELRGGEVDYWYLDSFFYWSARRRELPVWHKHANAILKEIVRLCGRVRLQDAANKDSFPIQVYRWVKLKDPTTPFFVDETSYYNTYGFTRLQGECAGGRTLDDIRNEFNIKFLEKWTHREDVYVHAVSILLRNQSMKQWLDAWEERATGGAIPFSLGTSGDGGPTLVSEGGSSTALPKRGGGSALPADGRTKQSRVRLALAMDDPYMVDDLYTTGAIVDYTYYKSTDLCEAEKEALERDHATLFPIPEYGPDGKPTSTVPVDPPYAWDEVFSRAAETGATKVLRHLSGPGSTCKVRPRISLYDDPCWQGDLIIDYEAIVRVAVVTEKPKPDVLSWIKDCRNTNLCWIKEKQCTSTGFQSFYDSQMLNVPDIHDPNVNDDLYAESLMWYSWLTVEDSDQVTPEAWLWLLGMLRQSVGEFSLDEFRPLLALKCFAYVDSVTSEYETFKSLLDREDARYAFASCNEEAPLRQKIERLVDNLYPAAKTETLTQTEVARIAHRMTKTEDRQEMLKRLEDNAPSTKRPRTS